MGLNASTTPKLLDRDSPTANSPGETLYLEINLEIAPMKGQPVIPMTAVFAPDPKQLQAGDAPVILWLHGNKEVWSSKRKGKLGIWGKSIQDYLKVDECKLREFVLQSSKRKFLLVAPTLNDRTGKSDEHHNAGGLLWEQAEAEAYLKQVLKGVKEYMKIDLTDPSNIILAAHSGGGHILTKMARNTGGLFSNVNEIWCFDCTYWGGEAFTDWAGRGHTNPRLWVYSTGGKGNGSTGDSANAILAFSQRMPKGAKIDNATTMNIEVWIDDYPTVGKPSSTKFFNTSYHGSANGHYESIEKYLPQLVEKSRNLA